MIRQFVMYFEAFPVEFLAEFFSVNLDPARGCCALALD
jgi:hypothetical protein